MTANVDEGRGGLGVRGGVGVIVETGVYCRKVMEEEEEGEEGERLKL